MASTVEAAGLVLKPEPLILATNAGADEFHAAAGTALGRPACDSVICAAVPRLRRGRRGGVSPWRRWPRTPKAADRGVVGLPWPDRGDEPDGMGRLAPFASPGDALRALGLRRPSTGGPAIPAPCRYWTSTSRPPASGQPGPDQHPAGRTLTEDESAELLAATDPAGDEDRGAHAGGSDRGRRRLGWDVVLKASARGVRGRPDHGRRYRDLDYANAMTYAWQDLIPGVGSRLDR